MPRQDLEKLSATGGFFKSREIEAVKSAEEHAGGTDGIRTTNNLAGNTSSSRAPLLRLLRSDVISFFKEDIEVNSNRREGCAWQAARTGRSGG